MCYHQVHEEAKSTARQCLRGRTQNPLDFSAFFKFPTAIHIGNRELFELMEEGLSDIEYLSEEDNFGWESDAILEEGLSTRRG
ncbi:hypothetical protein QE152_g24650 [Popillia japonica]|uniref:Uncharacterized protein n=1 Tax=Popillia japonica TaxID=7064 RepID=A0AAW1K5T3_POPJA